MNAKVLVGLLLAVNVKSRFINGIGLIFYRKKHHVWVKYVSAMCE